MSDAYAHHGWPRRLVASSGALRLSSFLATRESTSPIEFGELTNAVAYQIGVMQTRDSQPLGLRSR